MTAERDCSDRRIGEQGFEPRLVNVDDRSWCHLVTRDDLGGRSGEDAGQVGLRLVDGGPL
jgi:hypothetical protein